VLFRSQIAALAEADLYVRTGVAFETAWMARLRAVNPRMSILDAREGIPLRTLELHSHADEQEGKAPDHEQAGTDPHIWTSPPLAKQIAAAIRDRLTQLAPAYGAEFAAGYQAFAAELDALDQEIRTRLADLPTRRFLVFHPAWGYFAATYGLTQIPIEREGKDPGARALGALVDQARREGVKVVFVQPQFNPKTAEELARAIGGQVETLDDLAADYVPNLRRVVRLLTEAARP
jgi:zinc transport system substrate-binding protein